MIPEAAVEEAVPWVEDFLSRRGIALRGKEANALAAYILEAAAPHIRALALEDSAEAWQVRMDTLGRGSADAKLFMQQRAATGRAAK